MGRPDRRTYRAGTERAPPKLLEALCFLRTTEQPQGDTRTHEAQQRSHDHEPGVMQLRDTAKNPIHTFF